jgi:hypothetical protein
VSNSFWTSMKRDITISREIHFIGRCPHGYRWPKFAFSGQSRSCHQNLVICIDAAGSAHSPLLLSSKGRARGIFDLSNSTWRDADLLLHLRLKVYISIEIFTKSIKEMCLTDTESQRKVSKMHQAKAILFYDNHELYPNPELRKILSENRAKAISFPPHTSRIFQMINLVIFGLTKRDQ